MPAVFDTLFAMNEEDDDIRVFFRKMCGKMFGAIYGAVLSSRAAERDHKIGEASFTEGFHMRIHDPIDMVQKAEHFPVLLKESYDRLVAAGQFLIWLISSRIMDRTAIKHISAAIP